MSNVNKILFAMMVAATVAVLLPSPSAEAHDKHYWFPCLRECCRQKHQFVYASSGSARTTSRTTNGGQDNVSGQPGERDEEKESEEAGSRGGGDSAASDGSVKPASPVSSTAGETNRLLKAIQNELRGLRADRERDEAEREERIRQAQLKEDIALEVSRRFASTPIGGAVSGIDQNQNLLKSIQQMMQTQAEANKVEMQNALGTLENRMKEYMRANFQAKADAGETEAGSTPTEDSSREPDLLPPAAEAPGQPALPGSALPPPDISPAQPGIGAPTPGPVDEAAPESAQPTLSEPGVPG